MRSRSIGIGIGIGIWHWTSASSKSKTTIAHPLTLTLLAIPYIYVYKNTVKLETSSPSSRLYLSSTSTSKSTVQSVYHEYQRLDFLQWNLVTGPHKCGWRKCLFPLKTDPRIGYVVCLQSCGVDRVLRCNRDDCSLVSKIYD
eukprot:scaffold627_cov144-Skeletonema_menzelii.AAC.12